MQFEKEQRQGVRAKFGLYGAIGERIAAPATETRGSGSETLN